MICIINILATLTKPASELELGQEDFENSYEAAQNEVAYEGFKSTHRKYDKVSTISKILELHLIQRQPMSPNFQEGSAQVQEAFEEAFNPTKIATIWIQHRHGHQIGESSLFLIFHHDCRSYVI